MNRVEVGQYYVWDDRVYEVIGPYHCKGWWGLKDVETKSKSLEGSGCAPTKFLLKLEKVHD
jgi:hypothetical protein